MYQEFADIYDVMMDEIPYETWFRRIHQFLCEREVTTGTICELGCGTGTLTELFADAGYDMIGVDVSPDMLAQAFEKKKDSGLDILYIQQDMTKLELSHPVSVVISLCDSMNYLLYEEDMRAIFLRVCKALEPGGYFIFDLKTRYCFEEILGSQTRVEQDENMTCIWENYFYEEESVNEYSLTIFRRQKDSSLFDRTEEIHHQRAYGRIEVETWLRECGFEAVQCLDETMQGKPTDRCERIYFVARRFGKDGKKDEK